MKLVLSWIHTQDFLQKTVADCLHVTQENDQARVLKEAKNKNFWIQFWGRLDAYGPPLGGRNARSTGAAVPPTEGRDSSPARKPHWRLSRPQK